MGKNKTIKKRYKAKECTNQMTFDECELAILRHAVDTNEKLAGQKIASSEEIKKNDSTARSSDNLAEMCNFNNDHISCTPPDGYFMHNLRLRMEKA